MNTNKYLIASIAAGTWIFFYGFIVNTVLLKDFWSANVSPGLMRPEGQEVMWAIVASVYLQGFVLSYIFTRGHENRGIGEGFRFGLLIAVFVAALYLLFYAIQPWGMTSTLVTMVVDSVMYIGAGVILAAIYKT